MMNRARVRTIVPAGALSVLLAAGPAFAQTSAPQTSADAPQAREEIEKLRKELEALRQQYEARLAALEQRLTQLGAAPAAPAGVPEPTPPPEQTPAPAPVQPSAGSSKVFNPDIAAIGTFVGVAGTNPISGQPSLEMSEVEATFQAIVDPFGRADFFLSAGPEGVELEEGYITFTALPGNMLLKVGRMRAQFGKVNTTHTHQMPTADRPLVTVNLVGGEEGLSDSGLSLSHLLANPLLFVELTGEVYQGSSGVFQTDARTRPT